MSSVRRVIAKVFGLFSTDESPEPLTQCDMLAREFEQLHGVPPETDLSRAGESKHQRAALHAEIHKQQHTAICLSGGGIRSASFALGVLQGLARRKVLARFDYLSTVSGGGYTGGWLSAWLYHARRAGKTPDDVFTQLAGGATHGHGQPEAEPIRQVREYSNYLDPRLGLFSADVWTLIATVLRNLLLNWLVLVPFLAAILLVPHIYSTLIVLILQSWEWVWSGESQGLRLLSNVVLGVGGVLFVAALVYISGDLPSVGNHQRTQTDFLTRCFVPLLCSTGMFSLYWAWSRALDAEPISLSWLLLFGVGIHTGIWLLAGVKGVQRWRPFTWLAAAVSAAIAALGVWWCSRQDLFEYPLACGRLFVEHGQTFASVSVPLMLGILCIAGTLFVGIAANETTDDDREWWSRFGAWLLIAGCLWLATSVVIFGGPRVVEQTWGQITLSGNSIGNVMAGLMTALTGGLAAWTGYGPKSSADEVPVWRKVTFTLAAPAFVVLLLAGLATVNDLTLHRVAGTMSFLSTDTNADRVDVGSSEAAVAHSEGMNPGNTCSDDSYSQDFFGVIVLFAVLLVCGSVMGRVVAVNKFSLHGMYRSRLIRAFLGASRTASERRPNPFTGFDPRDNVFMSDLQVTTRPMHVVNMALNRVADSQLSWQERKAESFTVTPLSSGARSLGYRPSAEYGGPTGISLGTAITLSGAAASPNMGYHSSPAITFLLTLFNARLGAWLGNPGPAGAATWRRSDPIAGASPLLREMFGLTTKSNPYVYLSDGGHFENLGLYEMVARRCHLIVVSDAGSDGDYLFEDLGNAIRKIRIDHGIRIEFPDGIQIDKARERAKNAHGAVGVIHYADADPDAPNGVLLYLKATLSGDEPVDVMNYASAHTDFPHESTTDQWFGESQFESYRMLGIHTVDALAGDDDGKNGLDGLIDTIRERLKPIT
ncbi:MAG: patatin-like phospholipase family protein [Acidobacteriaceae bacterium]|jgi:hypothetical protein|nr:patatin-like phospholipase family protein [Acidobacteriaceae bacterium]